MQRDLQPLYLLRTEPCQISIGSARTAWGNIPVVTHPRTQWSAGILVVRPEGQVNGATYVFLGLIKRSSQYNEHLLVRKVWTAQYSVPESVDFVSHTSVRIVKLVCSLGQGLVGN